MTPPRDLLLLDGATGTELDRRGVDISLPLWSARAILDAPDELRGVHESFLDAGADAITTATFRTHQRNLALEEMGDRARELTLRAVEIAQQARDKVNPEALVFGSVAPLEDCYRPERAPDEETCESEHAELIEHLLEAGVDRILIETMGTNREAAAAAQVARRLTEPSNTPWMISFSTHSDGPPGALLSGEPVADLIPLCEGAAAIGVNCVAAPAILQQVELLNTMEHHTMPIIAYANVGEAAGDGNWISTDALDPQAYADYAMRWVEAGASIVGGCCGTRPETIRAIARRLERAV